MVRYFYFFIFLGFSFTQTTGKISGVVYDEETQEPIIGANVVVVNTNLGTATDVDGSFYIINISPGVYELRVDYIGYESVVVNGIAVSVNRTSEIDIYISQSSIQGSVVEVKATGINIKKDQTSTVKNISSKQIEILPIESIDQIIEMQAGVVAGHFRGGRKTEVTYLIDGIRVDEGFSGEGKAVSLEPESVSEIEVITGTFNAEYGKAMSGVVNQITKSGSNSFEGSGNYSYANYLSSNSDIFPGIDNIALNSNQGVRFQVSGPILKDKVFFFVNARKMINNNHLNGFNYFEVSDSSNYSSDYDSLWYSEHSGDSSFVAMNTSENLSLMGKIQYNIFDNLRTSFLFTGNTDQWNPYIHTFRYNPYGVAYSTRSTRFYALQINYMISNSIFVDFKYSNLKYYNGYYVYEDPLDSTYVADLFLANNPGFFTGGQIKDHSERITRDHNIKFDLNWQANKYHNIKTGVDILFHSINNSYHRIVFNPDSLEYYPFIHSDDTRTTDNDIYQVSPFEFSGYVQDKMEFNAMVINLGLRFDLFDPNVLYPSDYRNPDNSLSNVDSSVYFQADIQTQLSPRFGLAYQVADEAVLHFSYGHFFQMPPFYAMYDRSDWLVPIYNFMTKMGNPNLAAEKTVKYEIGLWQRINRFLGMDINLYYKDIYDLLSTKVITNYIETKYGLYTNKAYGNVRGLELKMDMIYENLSVLANYTLQFAKGIEDHPAQAFDMLGNNQDPVNTLAPLSWDQRHTFNLSVGYNTKSYGTTLTSYYNSGTTYTFVPQDEMNASTLNLPQNNSYKPATISVDLKGYYLFNIKDRIKVKVGLSVYNLFDRLNTVNVHSDTGRAYYSIITENDRDTYTSVFSTLEDLYGDPGMFSAPRQIKLSIGIHL